MDEKIRYLSEERFDNWRHTEFTPVEKHCADSKEAMEDMNLKVDAVLGDAYENSKGIAYIKGAAWVLVPVLVGLLVLLIRNGVH